ncbi:unnamed protein product [Orchesella dallaii]|uniref:Helicase with zinc finger domain n=1 Tax=Orchesella dallaii TaxID=48710 RepID=A0ABP1R7A8_9HEXA
MKGMANLKDGKSANDGDVGAGCTSSKKAKKLEKHLEEVNKELQSKLVSCSGGKGLKKQKMKPEQESVLLEQKCILLLKLLRHKEVVDEGYSIVGRLGANVVIFKCILIALVRLGKPEHDILELLNAWKTANPKCLHLLDTKRKFDSYLTALRSGMKHSDVFNNIEDALGLHADMVLSKQITDTDTTSEKKWRFRTPPPRHTTFSLCPRASSGESCIYGEECLFAHSQDELREWKMRGEGDKKENTVLDDAVESCSRSTKKRPIPNIYRSLLIPPLCIHYLVDLGKKIKEAKNIKDILSDDLQGIKMKVETPLMYQRRIDGCSKVQCTWSFSVGTKMPMGTVSILHDSNRECFRISSGMYYNKKKESLSLIELHPNNKIQTKLQVLNTFIQPSLFLRFNYGWPEMCYYKVDVTFESRDALPVPGLYRQTLVFDFKKDPKLVRHICIEVLPKLEPIDTTFSELNVNKSVWATSRAVESPVVFCLSGEQNNLSVEGEDKESFTSKNCDFPSLNQYSSFAVNELPFRGLPFKNMNIVDSNTGVCVNVKGVSLPQASSEDNLFLDDVPLNKENYCMWMKDFLDVELKARQKVLIELKKTVDVRLFEKYTTNPDCLYKYSCEGELYGKLEMMSDISYDTKLRKLINDSCSAVLISDSPELNSALMKPSRQYLCNLVDKLKSAIIIAIGRKAVGELSLLSDSIRPLQIQFVLDSNKIDRMKFTLEDLSKHHMELLFPSFENSKSPFLKVMDPIGLLNEEELLLNSRQTNVYNLLTEKKVLIDTDEFTPPVLVTGPVSTGKTYLLAHCLRALLRSYPGVPPNRILVCTQSDLAADIYITEYLHRWLVNDQLSVQRSKPLRIYDEDRFVDTVGGAVKHYCLFNKDGTSFRYPSKEEVLLHRVIIITLSTCAELVQIGLDDDTFTHIFIDEAALCLEAECVQPVVLAGSNTKVVIAGDVMQTYLGMFALSKGVPSISLLERLRNLYPFRHPFVVNLIENYTNHEVIVKFISEIFYHDQLRPASHQPCHPSYYPLSFQHIPSSKELQPDNGGGYYNMEEIRCVVDFTEELMRSWPEAWGSRDANDSVVVVTPFTNHVIGLRVQLQLKSLQSVNVEMVSNVLGKRFRVVIISTVRTYKNYSENMLSNPSDSALDGGFFSDRRLINTAISCAKSLVVVFGDALSLWSHGSCRDIWRKYLAECHSHQSLRGFPQIDNSGTPVVGLTVVVPSQENLPPVKSSLNADSKVIRHPPPQPAPLLNSRVASQNKLLDNSSISRGVLSTSVNRPSNHLESTSSWNVNGSNLHQAPKTDLFSAFSSNSESLYAISSKLEGSSESERVGSTNLSFNKISSNMGTVNAAVFKPLEGYRSPFELPSVAQSSSAIDDFKDIGNFKSTEGMPVENNLSPLIHQPMPLPTPTIPSHVLYNRNFLLEGESFQTTNIVEANKSFGLGNFQSSPQKFMSPLLRGPPGFTSVAYEPKLGMFSSDNSANRSTSPFRGGGAGGLTPKYGYKRNTYELPPRMLRNLTISNHRSTTPRKPTSRLLPAEMNFFEELGLDSPLAKETSRSASSTSTDNSVVDPDETVSVVDEEYSDLSPQSDWVEVKSTRKGKHQSVRKVRTRDKHLSSPEEPSEITSEMSVDDKVELITQMGFSKTQAIKALQACDKDLQRSVDWLISKPTSNKSSS